MSCEVSDEREGNVMDIAMGTLRQKNFPLIRVGDLRYIVDKKNNPVILVGYGHKDVEEQSRLCHIIKFRVSQKGVPCYGVVSAMRDYAVKHTRVAKVNIKVFASEIPTGDPRHINEFLGMHYIKNVGKAIRGFRKRHRKVNNIRFRDDIKLSRHISMNDDRDDSDSDGVSRSLIPRPKKHKRQLKEKKKKKKKKKELAAGSEDKDEDEKADTDVEGGAKEEEAEEELGKEDIEVLFGGTGGMQCSPDPDALFVSQTQTNRSCPQGRGVCQMPE